MYLTSAQKRALVRADRIQGRSDAELIREGIAIVTRQRTAEPTIPLFESGLPDLATRAERGRSR